MFEHFVKTVNKKCPLCEAGIPFSKPQRTFYAEQNDKPVSLTLSQETVEKIEKQLGFKIPNSSKFIIKED